MTIKQLGGVFGRNPTFNNVTIEGTLTFDGDIDINSDLTIEDNLYVLGSVGIGTTTPSGTLHISSSAPAFYMTDTTNNTEGVISMDNAGSLILNADLNNEATSSNIRFAVDGTERMRIDATGTVTANPTGGVVTLGSNGFITSKQSLDLATAGGRFIGESNRGTLGWLRIEQTTTGADGGYMMLATSASGSTSPTERVRIDSLGKVGIGTSTPTDYNSGADDLVVATSGDTGITIVSGASNKGVLCFADGVSASEELMGRIRYDHSANYMDFRVNNANVMTIDASGNLLVGQTTNTETGTGIGLVPDGTSHMYSAGTDALLLGRGVSDGDILSFNRSGTPVGSIASTFGTDIHVGTGDTRLRFVDDNDYIRPANSDGSSRDGLTDLGASTARFKDLYLSGGVVFGTAGGSVSSKTLDDYEEGTWDGVITDGTNNATMVDTECFYTKTGRLVTLSGDISTSALGSVAGSSIRISGVPFSNGAKGVSAAIGRASGLAITAGYIPTLYFDASSAALRLGLFDNAGGTTTLQAAEWTDDGQISFSITYMTS